MSVIGGVVEASSTEEHMFFFLAVRFTILVNTPEGGESSKLILTVKTF